MSQREADADLFAGKDVALSEGAIIQHPEFIAWVLDTAYVGITPVGRTP
jgi:hypothetical protein